MAVDLHYRGHSAAVLDHHWLTSILFVGHGGLRYLSGSALMARETGSRLDCRRDSPREGDALPRPSTRDADPVGAAAGAGRERTYAG